MILSLGSTPQVAWGLSVMPISLLSPDAEDSRYGSRTNVTFRGAFPLVCLIHVGLAVLFTPPVLTRIGVHTAAYSSLPPTSLQAALDYAIDRSLNSISVDGDMSTNDTAVVLANGAAQPEETKIDKETDLECYEIFRDELKVSLRSWLSWSFGTVRVRPGLLP